MSNDDDALALHSKLRGKIETKSKATLTMENLQLLYTPGVAAASLAVARDRLKLWEYTIKENTIAVVSDGSAVLGLGNLGAEGAIPVMEGKCVLFKELANVNAFPICLDTHDADEIIKTVRYIAPVFGGINLEDISSPKCFEIENALQNLGIPVMHDDQHGTAVVVLAALLNSLKVVKKDIADAKISILGAGAAGIGVTHLLLHAGARHIILSDSKGVIYKGRPDMNKYKEEIADKTNKERIKGGHKESISNADVVIGLAGVSNMITGHDIKTMAKHPVIFALSNPNPEILPSEAHSAGALIVGTGRSDYPNQINNSLAFPGIFRGALDARAMKISTEMKIAAAHAIAGGVEPTANKILPGALEREFVKEVAKAVRLAALA